MYRYYIEKNFNPTCANLSGSEQLARFLQQRCYMLQNRLGLPVKMLEQCTILEFGPAGGENALVAAMLGADVYLVEPVETFHQTIRDYFDSYHLAERLKLLKCSTLGEFKADRQFDLVIAEGFVYTTGPGRVWTQQLCEFCGAGGFVLLSMCETAGFLIEMLQSRVCRIASSRGNIDRIETARTILGPKWSGTSHSRSFESWANDVLYNPYVDCRWLNHSGDIVRLMYESGFDLYSAWPMLRRSYDVGWVRQTPTRSEKMAEHRTAALELIPSLMLGQAVPVATSIDARLAQQLLAEVQATLQALSDLTDTAGHTEIERVVERHRQCEAILEQVVADYKDSTLAQLMAEIYHCLESLDDPPERLADYFGPKTVLGRVWGSPNQYLVFQRAGQDRPETAMDSSAGAAACETELVRANPGQ